MNLQKKLTDCIRISLLLTIILWFTACSADTLEMQQPQATAASPIDVHGEERAESNQHHGEQPQAEPEPEPESKADPEPVPASDPELKPVPEPDPQAELHEVAKQRELPEGFVYLDEAIPSAQYKMGYYNHFNFVGTRIDGYLAPFTIATLEAAEALQAVSEEMAALGYQLVIYDAYRPQKAVDHFIRWSQDPDDTAMMESFYPNVDKDRLFHLGYLARKSGHSRGSTIDLTIAYAETGEEVDMGGPVDLLDERSHFATKQITEEQAANRGLLKNIMSQHGFKPYSKEWWHYTLKKEPYPDTYFDFDVK